MKISYKNQAQEKANNSSCTVTEHNLDHELHDAAVATITGRYPTNRRVVNTQCNELAFVFEGEGKVVINDKEHLLSAGDVVLIEAGDKYFWDGNMKIFTSCRPKWHIEQHQMVD